MMMMTDQRVSKTVFTIFGLRCIILRALYLRLKCCIYEIKRKL